jgi:surface carbohydrate biosynthesis protein
MPVIAVQNGTRWDFSVKNKDRMEYDYYFSFGSVEADIFNQGGHTVSNFSPIGSLRAGIYLNAFAESKEKEFDLCYISQYDPIPHNTSQLDSWTYEMIASYYEVGKRYFHLIAKYAEENKLRLCVAMRCPKNSANFANEIEYYSSLGKAKIEYIPHNGFSSYKAVQASRICFTISSTLGYEALGWGGRVIFAKDCKEVNSLVMHGCWTSNLVTHRLPELQRLYSLDFLELSFKATELLKMTNEKYMAYSKNAREYYMNFDDKKKPHEIIKNKIAQFISRGDRCDS